MISVVDLQANMSKYIQQAQDTGQGVRVRTFRGPDVILVSARQWEALYDNMASMLAQLASAQNGQNSGQSYYDTPDQSER